MDDIHDDRKTVYEIGYLIAGSIADEHVPAEADKVRALITKAGASVIADEAPHKERLAYTMRRKTVSGAYEKYDEAYFGWVKFEVGSSAAEALKKAVELVPTVLRMIMITTVRENTYLGKHAPAFTTGAAAPVARRSAAEGAVGSEPKKDAAPASIEEMDKSIEEMVKEA